MPMNSKQSVVLRQWELLKLLPTAGTGKTASELSRTLNDAGFSISKRQVERDLNDLMEAFVLDKDDRSMPHGWKWIKGASVDLPAMTLSEALSLHLVKESLRSLMPVSMLEGLETRFQQAEKQLATLARESPKAKWGKKVRYVLPTMHLQPPSINTDVLSVVQEALLSNVQIDVDYQGMEDSKPKPVRLSPLAIVNRGAVSYLVATAYDYSDVRLYAMHRIRSAKRLQDAVKRPAGFDLDEYIRAGSMEFGNGNSIRLSAWITPWLSKILEETPLSADQQLKMTSEKIKLTATVPDTWQLTWWLLSQGPGIEVTAPVALRRRITAQLTEALTNYQRTDEQ